VELDRLPASGRRLYEVPDAALQGYYLPPKPCSGIAAGFNQSDPGGVVEIEKATLQ